MYPMSNFNPAQLTSALADPAIANLSDADAAAALSSPIASPRPGLITWTTLAQAGLWGAAKTAQYQAAFQASIAAGNALGATGPQQQLGAMAQLLLNLFTTGFSAGDSQTAAVSGQIVAAGLVTQADANAALQVVSYRCGGIVAALDVTNARALQTLRKFLGKGYSAAQALLSSATQAVAANPSAGVTLTTTQLANAFAGTN